MTSENESENESASYGGPRPATPDWLRRFALDLFANECLRCGIDRPLDVAHVADWPTVLRSLESGPSNWAYWEFHQPSNVLVLCANCHRLLDDPRVSDVQTQELTAKRDDLLGRPAAATKVRDLLCRLLTQQVGRYRVGSDWHADLNRLFPLLGWLQRAAQAGVLDEPHQFRVNVNGMVHRVSLWQASVSVDTTSADDDDLPCWRRGVFVGAIGQTRPL